jgi:hypothetical protein
MHDIIHPTSESLRLGWQSSGPRARRKPAAGSGWEAAFSLSLVRPPSTRIESLPNQRTEARTGCNVLNRMTYFGMPTSVRIR